MGCPSQPPIWGNSPIGSAAVVELGGERGQMPWRLGIGVCDVLHARTLPHSSMYQSARVPGEQAGARAADWGGGSLGTAPPQNAPALEYY